MGENVLVPFSFGSRVNFVSTYDIIADFNCIIVIHFNFRIVMKCSIHLVKKHLFLGDLRYICVTNLFNMFKQMFMIYCGISFQKYIE